MNDSEEINKRFEKYANLIDLEEETEDLTDQVLLNLYELETEMNRKDVDLCISKRKNRCTCSKERKDCLCVEEIYVEARAENMDWGSNCTFSFRIEIFDENFKITRNMGWTLFSLHKETDEEKLLADCLYEKPKKSQDSTTYNRWLNLSLGKQPIKIPITTYSIRDQRIDMRLKYMEWQR